MKRITLFLGIFIGILLFSVSAYADSPVTSTEFSKAYEDISIVKKASELGIVNATIAKYLYDAENPIDVKAAVINALSWNFEGKSNADTYCKLIYKKSINKVKIESLKADQQFCIGYMMAMDDYFDVTTSLEYLKLAEKNMPYSFTVSIVRALVESQDMDENEWKNTKSVLQRISLKRDMRQEAINIILDYMALYSTNLEVSQNNVLIENEDSQIIYLYGTYVMDEEDPYQIVTGSDIAYTAICEDKYGIFYLKITGVQYGYSFIKIKNQEGKSISIHFDIVSTDTFNKLDNTISMYVGNTNAYINKTETTMEKNTEPYLMNGEQYISVDFIGKAVGGTLKYNSKKGTNNFTYRGKTIIFTSGSDVISINGKKLKQNSKIESKAGKQYISASDFAVLTDKYYIYDNGLILLTDKKVKISTITDDYILEDIACLITEENLTQFYPVSFSKNGKYGYKDDLKGNVIIEPKFELAYDFSDGIAAIRVLDVQGNKKYGAIDVTGKYVAEPIYEWVGTYVNGLIPVKKEEKVGFLDKEGNIKIPFQYKNGGNFCGGLAPVSNEEGKWGYIDVSGNLAIPYSYADGNVFLDGLAAVKIDNKWGCIDRTGKIVIQPIYEEACEFCYGIATVKLNEVYYYISRSELTVYYYDNGDIYVGEQKDGLFDGKGVFTYTDGSQYTGDFSKDRFYGKGVFTWPNGCKYTGDFLDYNNYTGKGVFTWTDGSQYIGDFLNNTLHGIGIYTYPDGTVEDGYWEDGVCMFPAD